MARERIVDIVSKMVEPFLEENQMELYNMEFLKEGKDWFLRVYIDKTQDAKDEYISTDDCEMVSRYLSVKLDAEDPIEQNYYLEVSSPGMDRVLLKEADYKRYQGYCIDVSLYKPQDGVKTFQGILVGLIDGNVTITDEKDVKHEFPLEMVAKANLAVIF